VSRWFPDHLELRFGDAPSSAASGAPALAGQVVAGKLDAALIAFERELDALDPPRGTRLTCVLAGEGVRYRVVPWRDDLASPAQRQLLATQCFAEAYGDAARSWTVRQNAGSHGAATLACAVDSTLLDRIDAMTQARGLRLVSVQPSLMHAFNRVRGRIEAELFWFVCVEGPWTTLLLTTGDEPMHVKVLPTASGDLSRLLDREWFALGIEAARCPVVVSRLVESGDASTGLAPTIVKGWQVIDLDAGVERSAFVQPVAPVAASAPAAATAVPTAVVERPSHPVETAIVNATPKSIESSPASLPAPMSAPIQATMPAPFIAKPFVPVSAEPRPQPAPVARPAVIEPVPEPEPESPSVVAIPQFEWWSAPAAAAPSSQPAATAAPVVAAPNIAPAAPAPVAAAVAPALAAPAPTALSAQVPSRPLPTVLPAAAAPAQAARAAAVPALPAARVASVPRPAPMARQAAAELAASTATDAVVNAAQAAVHDDGEAAPRKWMSLFRRRPKAPDAAERSAAPVDDMPVPRWVNGRWESS
jgi:hypothetical protein